MISLFLLLGAGIASGFIASTPLGPINLIVVDKVIAKNNLLKFIAGVVLADILFAMLAMWGFKSWMVDISSNDLMIITGGVFLIGLGITGILGKKFKPGKKIEGGEFIKGVVLCAFNPGFLLYWIFVSDQVAIQIDSGIGSVPLFGIGVGAGNILWFWLFTWLLRNGASKIGHDILPKIRNAISIGLIVFGMIVIMKHFSLIF